MFFSSLSLSLCVHFVIVSCVTVVGAGVLHQQVQFEILMVHELPNIVDIVEFIQHSRYEATVAAAATVACVWGVWWSFVFDSCGYVLNGKSRVSI